MFGTFNPIYLLPFVAAFIGWITNYVAVKMLFHPKQSLNLFGFRLQGVFPKRQQEFAAKIGQMVSRELFSVAEVTQRLADKASSDEFVEKILARIEELTAERLAQRFPLLRHFIRTEKLRNITRSFVPDLEHLIYDLVKQLNQEVETEIDVERIVSQRVSAFSSDKLEEVVFSIMRRELKSIEIIGGILGFLIGLAQLALHLWSAGI